LASKFGGASGFSDSVFARAVNGLVVRLLDVPLLGGFVRRGLVQVRYVGRRSGKTFEIPVGYRRSGDTITIGVSMPDGKNWWRNLRGEGGARTFLGLDGRDRSAHAVATRDERGRVSVTARLDAP
jgi:hypothetical protein